MNPILSTEVTDADLASLFGTTTRWVRDRVADGTIQRAGRNRYALGDSIRALIEYQAGGEVGEALQAQKLRKLTADATRSELELAIAGRDVAPVADLEQSMSNVCAIIRQTMRNVPGRVVHQIIGETDAATMKSKLLAEIDLALRQAASPENFTKESILKDPYEDENE